MNPINVLKLGLPSGSLQKATFELMARAGWRIMDGRRVSAPLVDDPEIEARLLRAQEISRYVERSFLDAGLTGQDWVVENDSEVVQAATLTYAKQGFRPIRWVLAVPYDSPIRSIEDLQDKRIATEGVNLTRRFLKKYGVEARVEFSWGATEGKVPDLADAICEITETGASLRAGNLRILETVMESATCLVANRIAWENPWKRRKIEILALLLQGVLAAEGKVGLKMNVPEAKLEASTAILPALRAPAISPLSQRGWVAVEVVVEKRCVRDLVPLLQAAGATGIVEYPLNKAIP